MQSLLSCSSYGLGKQSVLGQNTFSRTMTMRRMKNMLMEGKTDSSATAFPDLNKQSNLSHINEQRSRNSHIPNTFT